MSSKARELSKFSFDIHVNEGAGTLGIGTTADVGDRLYVEGGAQITGVTTTHDVLHNKDKIGVGLNSPQHQINTYGNSNSGGILVQNTLYASNVNKPYLIAGTQNHDGTSANWGKFGFQHRLKSNSGGTGRVTIDTLNGEAFCVANNNNIGIGTADPTTALHVFGGTTNDQVVTIESSSSSGIGAPDLSLFTNDPAIQNGETIGVLRFDSFNSSGTKVEYSRVATTIIDNGSGGNANAKVVIQARKDNSTMDTVAEFNGSTGDAKIAAQNGAGIILAAPNGTLYKITVTNAGAINVASA